MKKLFKCNVCNFIWEGEAAPQACPKCGQSHEHFIEMTTENAEKVYNSEKTNDIHIEIITLANKIIDLSRQGIELNLDPNCSGTFKQTIDEIYIIKQRCKAEIEGHVGKGKW